MKQSNLNVTPKAGHPFAWRKEWLLGLLLLAATVLAYQRVWRAGYIWDDDSYVTDNWTLHNLNGLKHIWFDREATPQYYPLVHTTFWLEYHVWKLNPVGYHVVNVLLHALGCVLLWRALKRLELPGAWLAAALFALHPVTVESVAWITERKNVLSLVFFCAAAWAWLRYVGESGSKSRRRGWWWAALVLFVCALLSKTVACALPAVLLLGCWWKKNRLERGDILPLVPFFLVGLGLGLQTAWLEKHHVGASGAAWSLSLAERVLIAGRALWFYAGKLVWPVNLTFDYPRWRLDAAVWWQWLFPAGALAMVAALWFARKRTGRGPLAAVLCFAVTLFPALGFIDVYPFRYSFVADHFQYLACIGPLALAGAGIERGLGRIPGQGALARAIVCAALLAALGALTWRQCGMYSDPKTLWRATLARNPGSILARNNLGIALVAEGKTEEAMEEYRKALETNPEDNDVRGNLAAALFQRGDVDEAIGQYRKAVEISPGSAQARNNLGGALVAKGDIEEGIAQIRIALVNNPLYAAAHNNLGTAMAKRGNLEEAIAQYRRALEINPAQADALYNLGAAYFKKGDVEEAIAQYRKALEISPGSAQALNNLGHALLLKGDVEGAMACFKKAAGLKPDLVEAWFSLGEVYLQKGDWDQAIACDRQAMKINPRYEDTCANLGMALFQKGEIQGAMDAWQQALEIKPGQLQVLNNLAWLLATTPDSSLRNGARAVTLAAQANQLSGGGDPGILRTLAAADAEAGSFGLAAVTARRALEMAGEQTNNTLAAALQKEIQLYEAGKTAREGATPGSQTARPGEAPQRGEPTGRAAPP
ncbi:MAG: tetratricopeptide repeat protein [Verrucomicrobiota bacterium]